MQAEEAQSKASGSKKGAIVVSLQCLILIDITIVLTKHCTLHSIREGER